MNGTPVSVGRRRPNLPSLVRGYAPHFVWVNSRSIPATYLKEFTHKFGLDWTRIIPYDVTKDIYVFDVDYHGKRLIPLKYVAQSDVQIGAILRYELDSSSDYSWYRDKNGNNVKGYHQELRLSLISLASDEELARNTFRSELPKSTTVSSVSSFVHYFNDKELRSISDWIGETLKEHLGYDK